MGENIYTPYWQSVLPNIISQFEAGKQIIQLQVNELAQYGERTSYYANFRIVKGEFSSGYNNVAQGRDLFDVLMQDEYFRDNYIESTLQITISKGLQLKIEILANNAPDFFIEEDFAELGKYAGQKMEKTDLEQQKTYDYLKGTYSKINYWAKQVQKKILPEGFVRIVQKPTNQASKF